MCKYTYSTFSDNNYFPSDETNFLLPALCKSSHCFVALSIPIMSDLSGRGKIVPCFVNILHFLDY